MFTLAPASLFSWASLSASTTWRSSNDLLTCRSSSASTEDFFGFDFLAFFFVVRASSADPMPSRLSSTFLAFGFSSPSSSSSSSFTEFFWDLTLGGRWRTGPEKSLAAGASTESSPGTDPSGTGDPTTFFGEGASTTRGREASGFRFVGDRPSEFSSVKFVKFKLLFVNLTSLRTISSLGEGMLMFVA